MKIKRAEQYLDWHTNEFVCSTCKKRQKLELPVKFGELSKKMDTFKIEHKDCEGEK